MFSLLARFLKQKDPESQPQIAVAARTAKLSAVEKVQTSADANQATPASPPVSQAAPIRIRKARIQNARNIFDLINSLSADGTLLRRSYAELCENIRDFTIAERLLPPSETEVPNPLGIYAQPPDDRYEFLGCGALHLYGPHLAEVRSIVVKPEAKGLGAGGLLLRALIDEAEEHTLTSVCLFTRIPEFFQHFGFREADRTAMPDKIYKDCQTCPRLYACDEVAMVRGPLPNIAVLGPTKIARPELVGIQLASTGTR